MKNHPITRGILCVIGIIALALSVGWIVMQLWNWLIPDLFAGATAINYCQALGILLLSKILFGGWGGRGRCGGCGGSRASTWRSRWKDKWEGMSAEEREKFRSSCGDWCEPQSKQEDK